MTDRFGTLLAQRDFMPFGGELSDNGAIASQKRFTGQERDYETEFGGWKSFDYFIARSYDSDSARFIQPDDPSFLDPFQPQSANLYGYAFNNPLRWIDPTGHCPSPLPAGFFCATNDPARRNGPTPEQLAAEADAGTWSLIMGRLGGIFSDAVDIFTGTAPVGAPTADGRDWTREPTLNPTVLAAAAIIAAKRVPALKSVAGRPGLAGTANHVFGPKSLGKHKLEGLLTSFGGDRAKALKALESAANRAIRGGPPPVGPFGVSVIVNGYAVKVTGNMVNGQVRVGSAFIP